MIWRNLPVFLTMGAAVLSAGWVGYKTALLLLESSLLKPAGFSWNPPFFLFFKTKGRNFRKSLLDWRANWARGRKLGKLRELFPQALGMGVQALQTGQTMPQVLEYLSQECPEPLRGEMRLVCAQMDLGFSAQQALEKMAERYPDFGEFRQFLDSYRVSRQTGASLQQLLKVLSDGLEEKNRILRKMESMTAQARLSGVVLGLLPFFLAAVLFFMDPTLVTPLFTQKGGWAILGLAAFLESIGFLWIRQILRLEV